MAIRVPGAMAGMELAALRIPSELVPGTCGAMVKGNAFDGPPSPATVTLAVPAVAKRAAGERGQARPPPPSPATVTLAVPAVAKRAAGTRAVNWEALTKVVTSLAPFHCTMELAGELPAVTGRGESGPPAQVE